MPSQQPDPMTLDVVQQTLRHLMLALAGASKADLPMLATLLTAATQEHGLTPQSKRMLEDLAQGAAVVAKLTQPPGTGH